MSGRVPEVRALIAGLRALLGGDDARALYEAARAAEDAIDASEAGAVPALAAPLASELQSTADEALGRAAALGHADAAAEVAWRIYYAERSDRAREAFTLAQVAGDIGMGQYLLGLFRYSGFGCAVDPPASFAHHQQAAEKGYADAMFELYVYYSRGIGTPEDAEQALSWCRRAAEGGSPRAMANLGGFYATGQYLRADPEQALHWYRLAAEAGHGRAAATLGVMYAQGQGTETDADAARRWLARAQTLGYDPTGLVTQCGLDPIHWLSG